MPGIIHNGLREELMSLDILCVHFYIGAGPICQSLRPKGGAAVKRPALLLALHHRLGVAIVYASVNSRARAARRPLPQ